MSKKKSIRKILSEYLIVSILIYKHLKDDKKSLKWMKTKNTYLFNVSPEDVILSGDGNIVIEWLKERET